LSDKEIKKTGVISWRS